LKGIFGALGEQTHSLGLCRTLLLSLTLVLTVLCTSLLLLALPSKIHGSSDFDVEQRLTFGWEPAARITRTLTQNR
jgi:hypothetical protein